MYFMLVHTNTHLLFIVNFRTRSVVLAGERFLSTGQLHQVSVV